MTIREYCERAGFCPECVLEAWRRALAEARPVPAGARETDPGRSPTEKEAGDG